MDKRTWKLRGMEFRRQAKAKGWPIRRIAEKMDLTEGAVRHYTNGTRYPKLDEFFKMCEIVGLDPCTILFGAPAMTPVIKRKLQELGQLTAESDRATVTQ